MDKNVLFGLFALFAIVFLAGCTQQGNNANPPGIAQETTGRAVFTLTDAAPDMGTIGSIKITVDSVSVQDANGSWVVVSSSPQTYDLLQLKASGGEALLADMQLKPGAYGQFRLMISKVMVTDAEGEKEAKLPSGELKIVGGLAVVANTTSAVKFDFVADESLHVTGNGEYILAPVVKLETRENAEVDANDTKDVKVRGGKVRANVEVGMDIDGNVGVGKRIPKEADVEIDSTGKIKVKATPPVENKGRLVAAVTDVAADMGNVTSIKITIENASVQSAEKGWVDIALSPQAFDLLQLKADAVNALLADLQLDAGKYNQFRLSISKVIVTDASGDHEAKMPSGELKIVGGLTITNGSTSFAKFDFAASDSLHITGKGEYIFAPVIQLETRENANVSTGNGKNVSVDGGSVHSIKVGMDIDGNVGVGKKVPSSQKISIENGKIKGSSGPDMGPY
ncbi:MAG: DUF4382 domain-containing protein [Candidatus Micrarchaeota archaeon]